MSNKLPTNFLDGLVVDCYNFALLRPRGSGRVRLGQARWHVFNYFVTIFMNDNTVGLFLLDTKGFNIWNFRLPFTSVNYHRSTPCEIYHQVYRAWYIREIFLRTVPLREVHTIIVFNLRPYINNNETVFRRLRGVKIQIILREWTTTKVRVYIRI